MTSDRLFPHLSPTQIAFLAGLLVGEGSFTGPAENPHCALKMTVRHEHLLRLVHSWCPFSHLYGPYQPPGNRQPVLVAMWRGPALGQLIRELEDFGLGHYCPHVYRRMLAVKERLLTD